MTDPAKPPTRKAPGLISAAKASSSNPTVTPSPSRPAAGVAMHRAGSGTTITSGGGSSRSTPTPSETVGFPGRTGAAAGGLGKMNAKFRPSVPKPRQTTEGTADVKPDIQNPSPSSRGSFRGQPRGRGRGRGGNQMRPAVQGIASGVFGSARPASVATLFRFPTEEQVDEYSSDEEGSRANVIDIALVSGLDESAPTSLWRDRRIETKGGKGDKKGKSKATSSNTSGAAGPVSGFTSGLSEVKDEPISPDKMVAPLPRVSVRVHDDMMDEDEVQDRDTAGRRVSVEDDGEVNEAQMVDLSESESEEEEEDMEGDFVLQSGMDDPQDKLYMFQFPHLFPHFVPKGPVDLTQDADGDTKEDIKDQKPNVAAKKKKAPPPEGRIGTLVLMKSGRVKMVLGDDIVMNVSFPSHALHVTQWWSQADREVTPGVPSTFVQNLTHLDEKHKSTTVLGEVNKTFVVTPDVDKLLQELYLNGGMTPGDKAAAERKRLEKMGVKLEAGLVKMEVD